MSTTTKTTKTVVACRPGMKQAAEAAFAGLDVVVDPDVTGDWEFRQVPLSFDEIMEAEIAKEERVEADPKQATTLIVPLTTAELRQNEFSVLWAVPYLAVRVAPGPSKYDIANVIKSVKPTLTGTWPDLEVNVPATIGALSAELKSAGYQVLSISEADGLASLDV